MLDKSKQLPPEQFIINAITGCVINTRDEYPDHVFYMKEGHPWFQSDNDYFRVSFFDVWLILREQYQLSHEDIQTIVKKVLEERFHWHGLTPLIFG